MKINSTFGILLLAVSAAAFSVPKQAVLGGDVRRPGSPDETAPKTVTVTKTAAAIPTPSGMVTVTKIVTQTPTEPTTAATAASTQAENKDSSTWLGNLFRNHWSTKGSNSGALGCFCVGGSVCCHGGPNMELNCDYGVCGI
ncbi:hypothetical protein B0T26DRAFT_97554 [Lasiosphaeria miniovina]|uniref:Hydrophobin n=1 Tax=Lasiosphaeria miniovina TaxID=1954250 RepID=A0AA40BJ40_9PEZI|nr:uncharacterized protein B0T26DRAFT_97554 [Lasiosphaeria miniovina]KAK0735174.1 hypothetical protein B0T26DRAFT_97554 [Lasiosphaeria miniovina]